MTSNTPDEQIGNAPIAAVDIRCGDSIHRFRFVATELGTRVVKAILGGISYPRVPFTGEVRTIVDVGANVGAASVYFALHHPQARVLAFEPSPHAYRLLEQNVKQWETITPFNFGLSDRNHRGTLFHGKEDSVTGSLSPSAHNSMTGDAVELRDAGEVMREQGVNVIDLLKLDTEGWESPILRAMSPWLAKVGLLYLEFHDSDERLAMDRMLAPTHVLVSGSIWSPHRGELAYVAKDRLPQTVWQDQRIAPPPRR